jgi:hypothetical protein
MIDGDCKTCLYFDLDVVRKDVGVCRRHAPHPRRVIFDANDEYVAHDADWPIVNQDDWCGDFKRDVSAQ